MYMSTLCMYCDAYFDKHHHHQKRRRRQRRRQRMNRKKNAHKRGKFNYTLVLHPQHISLSFLLFSFLFCFLLLFILSTEVSSLWSFMLHAHSTIIAHTHSLTQRERETARDTRKPRRGKARQRTAEKKNTCNYRLMNARTLACLLKCSIPYTLNSIFA